jgi:hypothetical protein
MSYTELSEEAIALIVELLEPTTAIRLANTCHYFRRAVADCTEYWQKQCNEVWDMTVRPIMDLDHASVYINETNPV